jgi:hypothetical protein
MPQTGQEWNHVVDRLKRRVWYLTWISVASALLAVWAALRISSVDHLAKVNSEAVIQQSRDIARLETMLQENENRNRSAPPARKPLPELLPRPPD